MKISNNTIFDGIPFGSSIEQWNANDSHQRSISCSFCTLVVAIVVSIAGIATLIIIRTIITTIITAVVGISLQGHPRLDADIKTLSIGAEISALVPFEIAIQLIGWLTFTQTFYQRTSQTERCRCICL